MPYDELLEMELRSLGMEVPSLRIQLLARFCEELERWNRTVNLTALREDLLVRRLVVTPLWVGLRLRMSGTLVDVGSGNGSPAISLHIGCGLDRSRLVEVRTKRAAFLRHLVTTLPVSGVEVHRARFEDIAAKLVPADWLTLQGVAATDELIRRIRGNFGSATKVLWITSGERPVPASVIATPIQTPFHDSRAWLFAVDQT